MEAFFNGVSHIKSVPALCVSRYDPWGLQVLKVLSPGTNIRRGLSLGVRGVNET